MRLNEGADVGRGSARLGGGSVCFCVAVSLFLAVWLEFWFEWVSERGVGLFTGDVGFGALARMAAAFALTLAFTLWIASRAPAVFHWLFRHRFAIGLAIVAVCTLAQASGSSISAFEAHETYLGPDTTIGLPRSVRMDEWVVLTPSFVSQEHNGYEPLSGILRDGATDTTLVYALPSWSLATLFRPFLWGFLAMGSAYGLAFYWSARIVALFLVLFELGRLLTDDKRYPSAALALLVTFSPLVQWWLAVNYIAELLVFGGLLVLGLRALLRATSVARACAIGAGMAWLCGCYLLSLYPAWQVSLFYVFVILGLWVLITWIRRGGVAFIGERCIWASSRCVAPLVVTGAALALVAFGVLRVFSDASEALSLTLGSVYPGSRVATGGQPEAMEPLVSGFQTLYLPFSELFADAPWNMSEAAAFVAAFPLSTVLGVWSAWRRRDGLCAALVAFQVAILLYVFVGVPEPVARLTLLSSVPANRVGLAFGLVAAILIVRCVALGMVREAGGAPAHCAVRAKERGSRFAHGVVFFAFLALGLLPNLWSPELSYRLWHLALDVVVASAFAWMIADMWHPLRQGREFFLFAALCVGVPGLLVNPVQLGLSPLTENDVAYAVGAIVEEDPEGRWLTDDYMMSQQLVALGAPTLNSTNTYPELDLWGSIDPDGASEEVYNRYAHVVTSITDGPTIFTPGQAADIFSVAIHIDDLDDLGADYLLTSQDLSGMQGEEVELRELERVGTRTIYEVVERETDRGPEEG